MFRKHFTIGLAIVGLATAAAQATVYYVDCATSGGEDGSSWEDAFVHLQDALDLAEPGDQVWVAACSLAPYTYRPDQGSGHTAGDRSETFTLESGVAIYGGFPPGGGDGTFEARDPTNPTYKTTLSGDLLGDDGPDPFQNNDENSYHVVTGSGVDETAILDGFAITAGNADGPSPSHNGAGMYNDSGNPTLTTCTLSGNSAMNGGGIYNVYNSRPTLTECTFTDNSASIHGAGVCNAWSSPTLINCKFAGNSSGMFAGGMSNVDGGQPVLANCVFSGNSATSYGGAIYNDGSATLVNCTFSGNSAAEGGGIYSLYTSYTLANCLFSGNSADKGGGIYSEGTTATLVNCTFSMNSAPNGCALACDSVFQQYPSTLELANCILWDGNSEIWNNDSSTIIITYSDVEGGWPGDGNIDADPLFVDADGPDDIPGTGDDNLRLDAYSPCTDAGDNAAVPEDITTDLAGNTRIVDEPEVANTGNGECPFVDMGAYERPTYIDSDGDNLEDGCDNCPYYPNSDQADCDGDDLGDVCDPDDDNDGVEDAYDVCPVTPGAEYVDEEGRPKADLDGNCEVNLSDFATFALDYGILRCGDDDE